MYFIPSVPVPWMLSTPLWLISCCVKLGTNVAAMVISYKYLIIVPSQTLYNYLLILTTVTKFTCRCRLNVYIRIIAVHIARRSTLYYFNKRTTKNGPINETPPASSSSTYFVIVHKYWTASINVNDIPISGLLSLCRPRLLWYIALANFSKSAICTFTVMFSAGTCLKQALQRQNVAFEVYFLQIECKLRFIYYLSVKSFTVPYHRLSSVCTIFVEFKIQYFTKLIVFIAIHCVALRSPFSRTFFPEFWVLGIRTTRFSNICLQSLTWFLPNFPNTTVTTFSYFLATVLSPALSHCQDSIFSITAESVRTFQL